MKKNEVKLPDTPCVGCASQSYCSGGCSKFELWFRKYWRGLRRKYLYGGN